MNILTAIFNSVFSVISSCFNAIDIDMFGSGFTILDFFIAILLLGLVFRFLGKSLAVGDRFNLFSVVGSTSVISNSSREKQITSVSNIHNLDNNSIVFNYRRTLRDSKGNTTTDGVTSTYHYE